MRDAAKASAAMVLLFAVAASAAPQAYVKMRDDAWIAVSVHYPDGYVSGEKYPAILEMSGYDGGSAQGRTMLGDAADAAWMPATGESFEEPIETGFAVLSDSRQLTESFSDEYVVVHASIRGTGCSSGGFDIYSLPSALDGYEVVEWMADQSWSNEEVAIFGHSYSGMTGFMIAATQPPSLKAVSVSGLIEDVYRGILYPGGVSNYGFPLFWSGGIRPASDLIGGTLPGLLRPIGPQDDPHRAERCGEYFATRPQDPNEHPFFRAGSSEFDNPWFRSTALISYLNGDILTQPAPFDYPPAGGDPRNPADDPEFVPQFGITVPTHITAAYEDEQTGGRGPTALWERIDSVPKRLLLTNGDHNTQNPKFSGNLVLEDRRAWIDHWMGIEDHSDRFGDPFGAAQISTTVLLEKRKDGSGLSPEIGGRIDALCGPGAPANQTEPCFPLPGTEWVDYYLRPDDTLAESHASGTNDSQTFLAGPAARQGWFYATWSGGIDAGPPLTTTEGPDELTFRTGPFTTATTIAGPAVAEIWAASTNNDGAQFGGADLFVQILDEGPDGELSYLQRGMLRMRHEPIPPDDDPDGLDERHDSYEDVSAREVTYRFWRYHKQVKTQELAVNLDQAHLYHIEIWPFGHVFRPDHRLVVKIHAAPAIDEYYAYVLRQRPLSQTTIWHDDDHRSRITFPFVETPGDLSDTVPGCGQLEGIRCVAEPSFAR